MTNAEFERRLMAVDWARHERPGFGSIPKAILGLLSVESGERQSQCDQLELCLLPQASLVAGTLYAIPFLQELIRERLALNCLYYILSLIVICTDDAASGSLGAECRHRIRGDMDTYLQHLQDTNLSPESRSGALTVISRLPEDCARWQSVVLGVYQSEKDSSLRADIADVLDINDDG